MPRPTKKQLAAKVRNWRILRLRGFYSLAFELHNETLMHEIDRELVKLDAETESDRRKRREILE